MRQKKEPSKKKQANQARRIPRAQLLRVRKIRESHLRLITDSVPAFVSYIDPSENYLFVNRTYRKWFGFSPTPGKTETTKDFWGSSYYKVKPFLDRAFAGETTTYENEILCIDGKIRSFEITYVPDLSERGLVEGLVIIGHDVTLRNTAEQIRKQSEARYRTHFEQAPYSIQLLSPEGYTLQVNHAWKALWKVPENVIRDYILAKYNIFDDPQLIQKGVIKHIQRAFQGEPSQIPPIMYDPFEIKTPGRPRWVDAFAYPVKDANGAVIEVVLMHRDVTEQIRLEQSLRQTLEEKNESIANLEAIHRVGQKLAGELDLNKLVQAITDAATHLTKAQFGAFFYNAIDSQGEVFTLYTISGVPRERFSKFPMPRPTAVFHSTFYGGGTVRSDDIRLDPRYGKNPPFFGMPKGHLPVASYLAVSVVSRSGEVIGGLFFGHRNAGVFTEKEQMIAEGLAAQAAITVDNARLYTKSQEAIRIRDEFISICSHELKTPVTSLMLQAQLAARQISMGNTQGLTQESLKKRADLFIQQLDRLNHLIDEMLNVSRIESGKLTIEAKPSDWVSLCEEVIGRFREMAEHQGISIHLIAPDSLMVNCDRFKIDQVLSNLVSNAIKYGNRKPIQISIESDSQYARIAVKDQGLGIPKEKQSLIFEKFERAISSKNISGLGLGLYIAQKIVAAHQGKILLESEVNVGSTFTIQLPGFAVNARGEGEVLR